MIRFAFVVATRNRHDELMRFVESLRKQKGADVAVLVVVDQSDPEVAEKNKMALGLVTDIPILYVRDEGLGLSRARNLGLRLIYEEISAAQEPVFIAFPDDDCVYPEGLLEGVVRLIKTHPSSDFFALPYGDETGIAPRFPKIPRHISLWNVFHFTSSVGLFVKARALVDMFFDEKIGSGTDLPAGEEIDLVIRLLARGRRGVYDPTQVVYHKVNRKNTTDFSIKVTWEMANAYVIARAARNLPSLALRLRLTARLVKDLIRWPFGDASSKLTVVKRLEGYRWGWRERLPR
jgi:GT2 family glycosyltransferase